MGGEWGHGTFACCEEGPAFCFLQGYLCGMCTIAKAAELSGNGQSCMINAIVYKKRMLYCNNYSTSSVVYSYST